MVSKPGETPSLGDSVEWHKFARAEALKQTQYQKACELFAQGISNNVAKEKLHIGNEKIGQFKKQYDAERATG
jgi:hypothetical protein